MEWPEGKLTIKQPGTWGNRLIMALTAGAMLVSFSGAVYAEDYASEIAALRTQASQQQSQAAGLQSIANDYQSKVNQLQSQINGLQIQININQLQYDAVSAQLADNQAKLDAAKASLEAELKNMYISSDETPLEMLVSSKSLGDYFNQQQYQDSVKSKIQDSMTQISSLQATLRTQQQQVAGLLSSEQSQKQQLADNQSQINQLLALAEQNVSAANQQVKSINSELSQKQAQQAAILAAASSSFGGTIPGASSGSGGACDNGHGNGGYPSVWCSAGQDSIQTPSGLNRECVSWAGWRWHQLGHPMVNWGNANTWDNNARAAGYSVNGSPSVGALAQTDAGPFGHIAVVEAIQGGNVIVSEMNYDDAGHFRYGSYPASYFQYIH